jgi:hypothetical protein
MLSSSVLSEAIFDAIRRSSCRLSPDIRQAFEWVIAVEDSEPSRRVPSETLRALELSAERCFTTIRLTYLAIRRQFSVYDLGSYSYVDDKKSTIGNGFPPSETFFHIIWGDRIMKVLLERRGNGTAPLQILEKVPVSSCYVRTHGWNYVVS